MFVAAAPRVVARAGVDDVVVAVCASGLFVLVIDDGDVNNDGGGRGDGNGITGGVTTVAVAGVGSGVTVRADGGGGREKEEDVIIGITDEAEWTVSACKCAYERVDTILLMTVPRSCSSSLVTLTVLLSISRYILATFCCNANTSVSIDDDEEVGHDEDDATTGSTEFFFALNVDVDGAMVVDFTMFRCGYTTTHSVAGMNRMMTMARTKTK